MWWVERCRRAIWGSERGMKEGEGAFLYDKFITISPLWSGAPTATLFLKTSQLWLHLSYKILQYLMSPSILAKYIEKKIYHLTALYASVKKDFEWFDNWECNKLGNGLVRFGNSFNNVSWLMLYTCISIRILIWYSGLNIRYKKIYYRSLNKWHNKCSLKLFWIFLLCSFLAVNCLYVKVII